jgi:uncharacterized protein HemY
MCVEALDLIVRNHLVHAKRLPELIEGLQLQGPLADLAKALYQCKTSVHVAQVRDCLNVHGSLQLTPSARELTEMLRSDTSLQSSQALRLYNSGCVREANAITEKILAETAAHEVKREREGGIIVDQMSRELPRF